MGLGKIASKVFNSPIKVLGSEKSQPLNTTISVIAVGIFTTLSLGAYGVYAIEYHQKRKAKKIQLEKTIALQNEKKLTDAQNRISEAIKGDDVALARSAIDEALKSYPGMKLENIPDDMPGGIMFYCVEFEKPKMLALLIEKGANPEHRGRVGTVLQTAAIRGDVAMLKAALTATNPKINDLADGVRSPLRLAAEFGFRGTGGAKNPDYCGVMKVLLNQKGIEVNVDDSPSLLYLVARQCENNPKAVLIFDKLIEKGARLGDDDMGSKHPFAKRTPNKKFIEKFLKERKLLS